MKTTSKADIMSIADILFPQYEEDEMDILDIPANERKLRTETYDFSVATICDYMKNGNIIIPPYQRGYVWGPIQASRLIESLITNCPIPVIYLSQGADEVLSVIDGNQRLTSILKFLDDEYELHGLTTFPELDGFKFSVLDPRFQRHIKNRTLRCICILKDTHPQIKFDVFERLNTGSVKLSAQELRHGLYIGSLMKLIERLSENHLFKSLTLTKNDKRMKTDELILRFFAFSERWQNYSKPLANFLNIYCEENRHADEDKQNMLTSLFQKTLNTVNEVLGDKAFKTYDENMKNAKFNAALFDAQMIAFMELAPNTEDIERLKNHDMNTLNRNLISSEQFSKYISSGTTDRNAVFNRITDYKEFLQKLLA